MNQTEETTCQHTDKIVKNGIVRCSDIGCDQEIDSTGHRGNIVEENQWK